MNTLRTRFGMLFTGSMIVVMLVPAPITVQASSYPPSLDAFMARPPIHAFMGTSPVPIGYSPSDVKAAYHLPATGGSGTIAIISAFHHVNLESDLARFDQAFSLPACTVKNKCLEIHGMSASPRTDSGWDLESALDSQWAHAIAPKAKLLIVEAASDSGSSLMAALDYANSRKDVVSVSMSWGGPEFNDETRLDGHFLSDRSYFASSGDDGAGVSWPAVSPNVIAVGGTRLVINKSVGGTKSKPKTIVTVDHESVWSGSGGGVSAFEKEPSYQADYSIPRAGGMRAIPDVSYAADPIYGFSVYHSSGNSTAGVKNWYIIGGTSAGAPQWAAMSALAKGLNPSALYRDKAAANSAAFFRDIVSGKNGSCAYFCTARKRYDYVTGLGSPVTYRF